MIYITPGCFFFVTGWWWQTASDKRSWSECRTAAAGQCRQAERSDVLPMSHTSTHKRNALIEGRLYTILSSLLWICIQRLSWRLLASGWLKEEKTKQNGEERKIKFYCGENGFFVCFQTILVSLISTVMLVTLCLCDWCLFFFSFFFAKGNLNQDLHYLAVEPRLATL